MPKMVEGIKLIYLFRGVVNADYRKNVKYLEFDWLKQLAYF